MPESPSISTSSVFGTPRKKRNIVAAPPPSRSVAVSRRSFRPLHRLLSLVLFAVVALLSLRWILSTSHDRDKKPASNGETSRSLQDSFFVLDAEHIQGGNVGSGSEMLREGKPDSNFACPRRAAPGSIHTKYESTPSFLQRGVLHAGSGEDVRRVLQRATHVSTHEQPNAFRVLVLGGSVSNCRGVKPEECWHSHLMRWFEDTFSQLHTSGHAKGIHNQTSFHLLNLAKSASGSTFFSYCWLSELELRNKHTSYLWGDKGPDLIIIETGINDLVQPSDFNPSASSSQDYAKDFEYLLRQMKALMSKPAVIVLDAASDLLASKQGFDESAEMAVHLAPSIWLDVPVISAKTALLTPSSEQEARLLGNLFLDDRHHPNAAGHAVLADLLLAYLEDALCHVHTEEHPGSHSRVEQRTLPVTNSRHFYETSVEGINDKVYAANCLQLGTEILDLQPIVNKGWERLADARDKQYMSTNTPGSTISYHIDVGPGGKVLLSWLRSKFHNLGDALVTLDGQSPGVEISGHWDLGWSIGVPTVLFENLAQGKHTIKVTMLKKKAKKGNKGDHFRLLAIAAT